MTQFEKLIHRFLILVVISGVILTGWGLLISSEEIERSEAKLKVVVAD